MKPPQGIVRMAVAGAVMLSLAAHGVGAAETSDTLSLSSYLQQVKERNQSYVSYEQQKRSAQLQVRTNDVQLSPSLVSSARAGWDAKLPGNNLMSYDRLDTQYYSVGVQQNTRYGTSLSLAYAVDYTNYLNMTGGPLSYYDARPVLEVSQQLWKNGFGKSTQAGLSATDAKWRAEGYAADAGMSALLVNAETAYWNLAVAREVVAIQELSLRQSRTIYDYVSGMAKKNLYEKADVIQAQASMESARLSLQTARNDERAALRSVNAFRNSDPDAGVGNIDVIDWPGLEEAAVPSAHGAKASVKAAEFQAKSTADQAKVSMDENEPSLELYGSFAVNGRGSYFFDTTSDSIASGRPTSVVGVKFSVPLDRSAVSDVKQGLAKQSDAASLSYKQKRAEQEQEWVDLVEKLADARESLKLSKEIEKVQNSKLENERLRLRQGRTTTYQVLQFEQDHLQSQLSVVRSGSLVLTLRAQAALYQY